jgi:hypothetical protein
MAKLPTETTMNQQPRIPDAETSKRLIANLRSARLGLQEANLLLAEINAQLAHNIRQQRLRMVRRSLENLKSESSISEQQPQQV